MQNCWRICPMDNRQVAFALGLAQKAGKVAAGDFAVRSALNGGKAKLMLIASDAAETSRKELEYLAKSAGVNIITGPSRAEIGSAIGKSPRTAVVITDNNFAAMIQKKCHD